MRMRLVFALLTLSTVAPLAFAQDKSKKPNVILIITDDQGHGDLGFHGNPVIKTPNLDKFARQSVRMKNFYVSPVCSPTRSSLMTGRYNYRTGVVDTFVGRSLMHTDEITIAEILRALGYRTGIFGKWHLGDNYPLRAMDQGFDQSLVLKGGGIGQPSDPPGGESYFNPVLQHNGKAVKKDGYISDIITDAALDFIAKNKDGPFFCYVPFNCPHGPLEVPKKYHDMYKDKIKLDAFPKLGFPVEGKVDLDTTAKLFGMVTNIDDNLGRLFAKLDEWGLTENTIVIFLTDNGPQQPRYNSGMRGRKGTVFEGGTRVPFFVRWPGGMRGDVDVTTIAAHIDIAPTLAHACGGDMPKDRTIDGTSLLPLWRGQKIDWPNRSLFFQWHRGDVPEMYRACAVRTDRWRLVQPNGVAEKSKFDSDKWMLFDIQKDPYESNDLAAAHPKVVTELKKQYEVWFRDVESTRKFAPPRIVVGTEKENPSVLTRQDWRSKDWTPKSLGHWELEVGKAGKYTFTGTPLGSPGANAVLHLRVGGSKHAKKLDSREPVTFLPVELPAGPIRAEAWVEDADGVRGVRFLEVRRD